MTATLDSYRIFFNDSEYAPRPPRQAKPDEKVDTKSVTPGTVVSCRVAAENPSPPKDYWWRSVIGAIICLPIGAIAMYRSSHVLPKYKNGEEDLAQANSKAAKKMSTLALTIGVCAWMFAITYLLITLEIDK